MDLSAKGGAKLAHLGAHRLESNIPSNKAKMFRKIFEHFCHAKMFRWDEHFSEHFFQSWNEIANTQNIAG
jgi:hypothetical protein